MLRHELGRASAIRCSWVCARAVELHVPQRALVTTVSHVLAEGNAHRMTVLAQWVPAHRRSPELCCQPRQPPRTRPVVGFSAARVLHRLRPHPRRCGALRRWISCSSAKGATTKVCGEAGSRGLGNVQLTGGVPHAEVFHHIDRMDICLNIFRKIPVSGARLPDQAVRVRRHAQTHRLDATGPSSTCVDKGFCTTPTRADEVAQHPRDPGGPPGARPGAVSDSAYAYGSYTWERSVVSRALPVLLRRWSPDVGPHHRRRMAGVGLLPLVVMLGLLARRNVHQWSAAASMDRVFRARQDARRARRARMFPSTTSRAAGRQRHDSRGRRQRVQRWIDNSSGVAWRVGSRTLTAVPSSCFYPEEEYRPEFLDQLDRRPCAVPGWRGRSASAPRQRHGGWAVGEAESASLGILHEPRHAAPRRASPIRVHP